MRKVIAIILLSAGNVWAGFSKLEALSQIETGNDDSAVGRSGEVSRYQIKPWIWRRYSQSDSYRNRQVSSAVAERYLTELEDAFRKRAGREPDDFDLYVLWNAGPTYYGRIGFSKKRVHPIIRERAQRFMNLRQLKSRTPDFAATALRHARTGPPAPVPQPTLPNVIDTPLTNLSPTPFLSTAPAPALPNDSTLIRPWSSVFGEARP